MVSLDVKLLFLRYTLSVIMGIACYNAELDGYLSLIIYSVGSTFVIHFVAKPEEDVQAMVWADGLFPGIALYCLVWIGLHQI